MTRDVGTSLYIHASEMIFLVPHVYIRGVVQKIIFNFALTQNLASLSPRKYVGNVCLITAFWCYIFRCLTHIQTDAGIYLLFEFSIFWYSSSKILKGKWPEKGKIFEKMLNSFLKWKTRGDETNLNLHRKRIGGRGGAWPRLIATNKQQFKLELSVGFLNSSINFKHRNFSLDPSRSITKSRLLDKWNEKLLLRNEWLEVPFAKCSNNNSHV